MLDEHEIKINALEQLVEELKAQVFELRDLIEDLSPQDPRNPGQIPERPKELT